MYRMYASVQGRALKAWPELDYLYLEVQEYFIA